MSRSGGGAPAIQTRDLAKQYGRIRALKGVSLRVEKGEIFGLLGQNGAGKTTLIKILLGILSPTEGEAEMLSEPVGRVGVRRRIGYLPEDHRFPDYHTGASLLGFYGTLLDMPMALKRQRIPEVLEMVGLKGRMDYKIRTYSKGMKQRLGIAQALMHNPEIIFLDEPTDGVDPVGRREIREIMQDMRSTGTTIFLNSHLLGEVELICDRVAILDRGSVMREGTIIELTKQKGLFRLGLAPGERFPVEEVAALGYTVSQFEDLWEIILKEGQEIDPVTKLLFTKGLRVRHLIEKRQTLEELFMSMVESAEPGVDGRPRRPRPPRPPQRDDRRDDRRSDDRREDRRYDDREDRRSDRRDDQRGDRR